MQITYINVLFSGHFILAVSRMSEWDASAGIIPQKLLSASHCLIPVANICYGEKKRKEKQLRWFEESSREKFGDTCDGGPAFAASYAESIEWRIRERTSFFFRIRWSKKCRSREKGQGRCFRYDFWESVWQFSLSPSSKTRDRILLLLVTSFFREENPFFILFSLFLVFCTCMPSLFSVTPFILSPYFLLAT